ncbi:hypothetical protein J1614_008048 [Plenodomus biglobosus]|nr:hypothetical protein J1614_008048 [Plenodomus biglobosus]
MAFQQLPVCVLKRPVPPLTNLIVGWLAWARRQSHHASAASGLAPSAASVVGLVVAAADWLHGLPSPTGMALSPSSSSHHSPLRRLVVAAAVSSLPGWPK